LMETTEEFLEELKLEAEKRKVTSINYEDR
jgi:hypothetical protein